MIGQRPWSLGPGDLPVSEGQLVQPDRIGLLPRVAVLLVVDSNAIPRRRGRSFIVVQRRGLAVQRNRLEQKVIRRGSLYLNDQVVPRVVHGITGNPGRMPLLSGIV